MIEGAICEDETDHEEYKDVAILRFVGPLSVMLDDDWFMSKVVEEGPSVHCRPPASLQVCRESRMHTLTPYRRMEHTAAKQGSFYFNPCRDVLWLSGDFTDEPDYLEHLTRCYGEQLNGFETLLVEESAWLESTPAGFTSLLEPFGGLKAILLLLWYSDSYTEGSGGEESDEGIEDADGGEGVLGSGDENNDQGSEIEARKLYARADRLRAEYAEFLEQHDGVAKSFRCMDRSLTFY
jgi:hypothetical protein